MNLASEKSCIDYAKYYQSVFNNAYDAMFIETTDGQILDVNPAACNLTGYTRDELLSMNVSRLLPSNQKILHCELTFSISGSTKEDIILKCICNK